MIGKIFKVRTKNNSLPIAKNKYHKIISISDQKLNRPYVVLFSNEKVYFLSIKTVKKENIKSTYIDKENVLIPTGIYDDNHFGAINTSTINVMDKKYFWKLIGFIIGIPLAIIYLLFKLIIFLIGLIVEKIQIDREFKIMKRRELILKAIEEDKLKNMQMQHY